MNCLIILLLLCCNGHSNGVCRDNDHNHSCGCAGNKKDNSCGRDDRRDNSAKTAPWQDYAGFNRNDSYNRNETCGCEEN